jgi:hypothetical protein
VFGIAYIFRTATKYEDEIGTDPVDGIGDVTCIAPMETMAMTAATPMTILKW